MTYGGPSLAADILLDREISQGLQHIINLGQVQKPILDYANHVATAPPRGNLEETTPLRINPADPVLLKTWKKGSPEDLLPKWKGLI